MISVGDEVRQDRYNNDGIQPLCVPGYPATDINHGLEYGTSFIQCGNASWESAYRPTARELAMLQLMEDITDRHGWAEMVCGGNASTLHAWHEEALERALINEPTWLWCLAELRDKAETYQSSGRYLTLNVNDAVCKSDCAALAQISQDLGLQLKKCALDPSLFPLVFGKTRVLLTGGTVPVDQIFQSFTLGEPLVVHKWSKEREPLFSWCWASSAHQWLPFEVQFSTDNRSDPRTCRIASYINNVHPRDQRPVYDAVERLLPHAIGMWNDVVVRQSDFNEVKVEFDPSHRVPRRIKTWGVSWLPGGDPWEPDRPWRHPDPGESFSYQQWARGQTSNYIVETSEEGQSRVSFIHDLGDHRSYSVALEELFREKGLQVIAKASGVELAPSTPSYAGDNWTVEGLKNERICATARLFYSVENVSDPRLRFQNDVQHDEDEFVNEHWRRDALFATFGIDEASGEDWIGAKGGRAVDLGAVSLRSGRMLAWPNLMRTRLDPFAIQDVTQPGHVRWLSLYLVDPHYRIISTRNVPPQRADWWLKDALAAADLTRFALPTEIVDMIAEYLQDWPMGMKEAQHHQRAMNAERNGNIVQAP